MITTSTFTRRQFIRAAAIGAGCAAIPSVLAHSHTAKSLNGMASSSIGLQLYTLRDIMKVSVPATLKLVGAVGYNELEFAGYFGHSAKEISTILKGEGLTAPSAHIQLDDFDNNLEQVLEDAQTVGHKYLVVPWLSEARRRYCALQSAC